jgi:hypothetical protein
VKESNNKNNWLMQKMAAQNDRKEFKNNLVKHKTNTP